MNGVSLTRSFSSSRIGKQKPLLAIGCPPTAIGPASCALDRLLSASPRQPSAQLSPQLHAVRTRRPRTYSHSLPVRIQPELTVYTSILNTYPQPTPARSPCLRPADCSSSSEPVSADMRETITVRAHLRQHAIRGSSLWPLTHLLHLSSPPGPFCASCLLPSTAVSERIKSDAAVLTSSRAASSRTSARTRTHTAATGSACDSLHSVVDTDLLLAPL